jgi:hypothetical protein
VGQNVNDVNPLLIVSDLGDEAILVPSDIEDSTSADRIGVWKIAARLGQVGPFGVFRYPIPVFERLFGVGMRFPKLAQGLPADYTRYLQRVY